jgi:hypothetical protein
VVARDAVLDACYGDNHGPGMPGTWYVALLTGGVELTAGTGGYARAPVSNDSTHWPDAAAGIKSNGLLIAWPATTGAWSSPSPDGFALFDALAGGNQYDTGPCSFDVPVNAANMAPTAAPGALTIGD